MSLALANWGRIHGWEHLQGETEDLSEYVKAAEEVFGPRRRPHGDRGDPPNHPRRGEVRDGFFFPHGRYIYPSGEGYIF